MASYTTLIFIYFYRLASSHIFISCLKFKVNLMVFFLIALSIVFYLLSFFDELAKQGESMYHGWDYSGSNLEIRIRKILKKKKNIGCVDSHLGRFRFGAFQLLASSAILDFLCVRTCDCFERTCDCFKQIFLRLVEYVDRAI